MVVLLKGEDLSFLLGLGTKLPVLHHFWIEVTIWDKTDKLCIMLYIHVNEIPWKSKKKMLTSKKFLGNVQGVSKEEILIVEKVADDVVLLRDVVLRELW